MPDTDQSTGATPAVPGATPGQTPPVSPAADTSTAATAPPATGDADALGDAGKRALDSMKAERNAAVTAQKAAEKERDDLKLATASDTDKAIAAAKKEGADGVIDRVHATVRRVAVREALATAGAVASLIPDLAKADEFATLKVNDDDEVDAKELAEAVKAHKARVPDAYKAAAGTADGGARGGGDTPAKDLQSAVERHYANS